MHFTISVRGMTATSESRTDLSEYVVAPSLVSVEGSKRGSLGQCQKRGWRSCGGSERGLPDLKKMLALFGRNEVLDDHDERFPGIDVH